jgi:hypothetical protein
MYWIAIVVTDAVAVCSRFDAVSGVGKTTLRMMQHEIILF